MILYTRAFGDNMIDYIGPTSSLPVIISPLHNLMELSTDSLVYVVKRLYDNTR